MDTWNDWQTGGKGQDECVALLGAIKKRLSFSIAWTRSECTLMWVPVGHSNWDTEKSTGAPKESQSGKKPENLLSGKSSAECKVEDVWHAQQGLLFSVCCL